MKMNNDPHSWPDIIELLHGWWRGDTPLGAVLFSVIMAGLRIAYGGGGWKKMLLEGLLCGALTLTVASGLEYLSIPKNLSVGIGGGIGFIGVEQFRKLIINIINIRFGGSPKA
ncbi:TPA: phage holin, lambda family [Klebsiella pneumoniae]|mgnify:FL=1|uniref:Phage holin, lambda family n=1 Tax=Klebsiella variicola TaxID=244366 RepID=A0AAW9PGB4_KLEVA|nr:MULTISPECIES: phage holin, lambda family [Klebsiella]HDS7266666.1 phage holin, lambda family [Klebsiella pneumoniae subsp. pneumoniae]EIX9196067.1 phage holin, lambda family [Klebsiella pneumoniae]EJD6387279.1 phage holin, lambda family [Klebsiella pneumoniae]EKL0922838.1 phage holin, lambda family [Klebsiella pneumoniae]EKL1169857.1 phage holin, lambda family [Klebsiella pneumoniae]